MGKSMVSDSSLTSWLWSSGLRADFEVWFGAAPFWNNGKDFMERTGHQESMYIYIYVYNMNIIWSNCCCHTQFELKRQAWNRKAETTEARTGWLRKTLEVHILCCMSCACVGAQIHYVCVRLCIQFHVYRISIHLDLRAWIWIYMRKWKLWSSK